MTRWLTVERVSSYEIAKRLWEQGTPTRGDDSTVVIKKSPRGEWSPSTIRRMLSNPLYKGEWYWGKTRRTQRNGRVSYAKLASDQWTMVRVPAVVDPDTWDEAQQCLAENKATARRNTQREYLLR
jgi:site-specific DNA recombinase